MKYTLKIKPYAESEKGYSIEEFDEEEWDMVVNLQERLIRNFKEIYPEISFEDLISDDNIIIINFYKENELTEDEMEEYIDTLCGNNMENIIIFDNVEYCVRGEIILNKPKKKLSILDHFNQLCLEFS